MSKRTWNRRTLLLLLPAMMFPGRTVIGQQAGSSFNGADQLRSTRHVTPLVDQLRVGLRVNTAAQTNFLQAVVQKVENGEISQSMVNVVYKWAISRNEKYPFPYFQVAIKELAKRRGVTFAV